MDQIFFSSFKSLTAHDLLVVGNIIYWLFIFFVFLYLRNLVASYFAFIGFRSNLYVSIGDTVIYVKDNLLIELKIKNISMRRIVLKNDEYTVVVPMKDFYQRDWIFKHK